MRIELDTDRAMGEAGPLHGTTCAVCGGPFNGPAALWLAVQSLDFFLHKYCEPGFTPEVARRLIGDMVLVIQDETLQDAPPERN